MIYAAGARQGRAAGVADRSHRPLYDQAVLASIDPGTVALAPVLTYPARRFGAPAVGADGLVLCTEREVLRLGPDGLSSTTHPWLADVHHAIEVGGRLLAVATALDGVVTLPEGTFESVVGGGDPLDRDLREAQLPRADAHPNYLFRVDGAVWVTRGIRGDAVRLGGDQRWAVADQTVHDGVVAGDGVWFTAVDGRLVRVDPETGRVSRTVDLRQPGDGPEPLGWCRGLALVDGVAFVGFTRLRPTTWRARLAWTRGLLRGKPVATRRPTRVDAFEVATGRRIGSLPTAPVGLDAVFGLVSVRHPGVLGPW